MLFALAFIGFMLAGCTQNNTSPTGNNPAAATGTPSTTASGHVVSPAGNSGTPANSGTPTTPGTIAPPSGNAKAELIRLAGLMNSTKWKADYSVDMTGGASQITGMSLFYDGGHRARIDMASPQMNLRVIYTSTSPGVGTGVACYGKGSNWTCVQTRTVPNDTFKSLGENVAGYTVTALPSRTIAGTTASCFNVTGMSGQPTSWASECYGSSGAILFLQTSSGTGASASLTTMTATSVSTGVSDSDFVPPATPLVVNNTYKGQ